MRFVEVEVDAGPAHEDGLSLRFKRADDAPPRAVTWVAYESEQGLDGRWRMYAAHGPDDDAELGVTAVQVEDSSDGVVWLLAGGRHGIVLEHEDTGTRERAPYLVVSQRTPLG
jgi:hypothetical protein